MAQTPWCLGGLGLARGFTPFGQRIRDLRRERGVNQKDMARDLQISAAYLSALERGKRGRPSPILVDQICGYFHIIWDDADALRKLAKLSHPRVVVDTSQCEPEATELANRLAEEITRLPLVKVKKMLDLVMEAK